MSFYFLIQISTRSLSAVSISCEVTTLQFNISPTIFVAWFYHVVVVNYFVQFISVAEWKNCTVLINFNFTYFCLTLFCNVQSNCCSSNFILTVFNSTINSVNFLIISVQRHPDNVTWFEINCFIGVDVGCCFFDDITVFVCYKEGTFKCKTFWPRSCVVGTAIVGDSKSVSAHAQYHSRSHSYGKYFFHSLSSS